VIWSGDEDAGFLSSHRVLEILPERDMRRADHGAARSSSG
jgi:hypothetical protein